jgi:hypothetical protein
MASLKDEFEKAVESVKAWFSKEFGGKVESDLLAAGHNALDSLKDQGLGLAKEAGADLQADVSAAASGVAGAAGDVAGSTEVPPPTAD